VHKVIGGACPTEGGLNLENDVVRTPIVIPKDAMVALPTPRKQRLQLYLQAIVSQLQ
jgi:hypothetical protein